MKNRRLFLAVNILALLLSLLTALRVLPGPDMIGVALAFYVLFLLPGYSITRLLSARTAGPLEEISRIFLAGLVFLAGILLLGFVPGLSYLHIVIAGSIVNTMLLLVACLVNRPLEGRDFRAEEKRKETRLGRTRIVTILLLFVVSFVFFYGSGETSWNSDALDHISYVRRGLDAGELFPGDSFHRDGDGVGFDPRKGIWHPAMALWAFQADTPVTTLWRVIPSFIAFFAIASFLLFVVTVTGRPLVAPLALLLFLLFYRGEGIGWLTKSGFSRNMAQVTLWIGASFMIRYAESGGRDRLYWICAASLFGTACHLVFALNMSVTCLALLLFVLFFNHGRPWRVRAVAAVAATAAAAVLPIALRASYTTRGFNLIHAHRQGMLILNERLAMVDPAEVIARLGPAFFYALLLVPFFMWAAEGGERRKLTFVLFLLPVLLVLNPFTGGMLEEGLGYLHYRALYAAPLYCYLGLALAGLLRVMVRGSGAGSREKADLKRAGMGTGRTGGGKAWGITSKVAARALAALLLLLFAYLPLRLSLPGLERSIMGILEEGRVAKRMELAEQLDAVIPRHSIIASDPRTSYLISAFTDHFVTVTLDQHCSPADTAALRRLRETRDLFSPAVPLSESSEWLQDQDVGYLLVDTGLGARSDFFDTVPAGGGKIAIEKFRACGDWLEEIDSFGRYHLFRLDREALSSEGRHPCYRTAERAIGCTMERSAKPVFLASTDGITLDGIAVESAEIFAGDTLRGRLCWSIERDIEYGLPFEWTIRIDGDFPRGASYRHWYGKQYRRRIEQLSGGYYRFTHSERLGSGNEQPDQWEPGSKVAQDFVIPVTEWLHGGEYVMRASFRRLTFLPNRTIGDYFLNEDSFQGIPFDSLRVSRRGSS